MTPFLALRDRLLARPGFQRWAARFPLTRPVARREARALFDVCAGFVYAQVLTACLELNVFERVAARPVRVAELAAACAVPVPAMTMLVRAAASLRLLSMRGEAVRLGGLGAALRGNPGVAAMVAHHRVFYADVADPVALLRGEVATGLRRFWPYKGGDGDFAGYSALMAATQPMIAAEVLAAYEVRGHACVLDVGGGDGSFLRAVAKRSPGARLWLFDLPAVAARAEAAFAQAGVSGARIFAGDVVADKLPLGADLITLVRVLHDHDDAVALQILQAVRAALPSEGVLLVAEPMAGTRGAEPIGDAYFGFYLLAMGSGRARRAAELEALLAAAGFARVRRVPTSQPMLTSVLIARP
jgi:demethylspheroidene O-methyltransferase